MLTGELERDYMHSCKWIVMLLGKMRHLHAHSSNFHWLPSKAQSSRGKKYMASNWLIKQLAMAPLNYATKRIKNYSGEQLAEKTTCIDSSQVGKNYVASCIGSSQPCSKNDFTNTLLSKQLALAWLLSIIQKRKTTIASNWLIKQLALAFHDHAARKNRKLLWLSVIAYFLTGCKWCVLWSSIAPIASYPSELKSHSISWNSFFRLSFVLATSVGWKKDESCGLSLS